MILKAEFKLYNKSKNQKDQNLKEEKTEKDWKKLEKDQVVMTKKKMKIDYKEVDKREKEAKENWQMVNMMKLSKIKLII